PWPGPIGDVWSALDLHAHPTRYDSSPIAIAEAMSLGLPSVATDVGGIGELISDTRTGRLLPADVDSERLAGCLAELLDSEPTRRAFGLAARARYEARHSPRALAAGMEDVYLEVSARRAASRA
ncbi:MAG: glycosyltransferase family 4 protein, partial [Deltaproteobacteria bacterium]|nr:glycosyltransferase family 4 protein [Deltaproteobacteria bacterium]